MADAVGNHIAFRQFGAVDIDHEPVALEIGDEVFFTHGGGDHFLDLLDGHFIGDGAPALGNLVEIVAIQQQKHTLVLAVGGIGALDKTAALKKFGHRLPLSDAPVGGAWENASKNSFEAV